MVKLALIYNLIGKLGLGHNESINVLKPTKISIDFTIAKISAGGNHSLLLTKNGVVYSFGSNYLFNIRKS
jgi:alpha-tubulin suppressor-like RCC1 family protein